MPRRLTIAANEWHGLGAEQGMPFGRYVDADGWLYRVETDGNGGTVNVRERHVGVLSSYGLPAAVSDRLRAKLAREFEDRENIGLHPKKIRELALGILERHGPMTREELVGRMATWTHETTQALGWLKRRGKVECYASDEAAGRKYLWAACNR